MYSTDTLNTLNRTDEVKASTLLDIGMQDLIGSSYVTKFDNHELAFFDGKLCIRISVISSRNNEIIKRMPS